MCDEEFNSLALPGQESRRTGESRTVTCSKVINSGMIKYRILYKILRCSFEAASREMVKSHHIHIGGKGL